jgi:Asp-tRNA(Asn)/Glu-tRNA(Gln) amidotransferase A subunit family amidase
VFEVIYYSLTGNTRRVADAIAVESGVAAEDVKAKKVRAPFGQGFLPDAAATALTPEEYEALGAELRTEARAYIDGLLADAEVDVLASRANIFSNAYAVAGYPAITVPDGPLSDFSGLTLIGPYLSDGELIGCAFAFEQATKVRTSPPVGD